MKGGVASGVVYPGAILALAKRYRFRNVGGTSAGAIAATVTAAAELGRREGKNGGFERLREVADAIGEPNLVLGLFQPRPENRSLFELAVKMMEARRRSGRDASGDHVFPTRALPDRARGRRLDGGRLHCGLRALPLARLVVGAHLAGLAVSAAVGVAFLGVSAVALTVSRPSRALARTLGDRNAGFGLCPGTAQEGFDQPALTDWLHRHIQACAGRNESDPPLTFADLKDDEDDARSVSCS